MSAPTTKERVEALVREHRFGGLPPGAVVARGWVSEDAGEPRYGWTLRLPGDEPGWLGRDVAEVERRLLLRWDPDPRRMRTRWVRIIDLCSHGRWRLVPAALPEPSRWIGAGGGA